MPNKYIVEHSRFGAQQLGSYANERHTQLLLNGTTATVFHDYQSARNAINRTISYGKRHKLNWLDTYRIKRLEGI